MEYVITIILGCKNVYNIRTMFSITKRYRDSRADVLLSLHHLPEPLPH